MAKISDIDLLKKYEALLGYNTAQLTSGVTGDSRMGQAAQYLYGTPGFNNNFRQGASGQSDVTKNVQSIADGLRAYESSLGVKDAQGRLAYGTAGNLSAPVNNSAINLPGVTPKNYLDNATRSLKENAGFTVTKDHFGDLNKEFQAAYPGYMQAPLNKEGSPDAPRIWAFEDPNTIKYDPKYGYIIPKSNFHPTSPDAVSRYGQYVPLLLFGAGVAASSLAAGGAASSGASGAAGGTAGGASGTATTAIDIGAADLGGAAASGGAFGGASAGAATGTGLGATGAGLGAGGAAAGSATGAAGGAATSGGLFGTGLSGGQVLSGAGTLAGAGGVSGGSGGGNAPAAQSYPYNADGLSPNGYDGSGIGAGLGNNGGNNNTAALDQLFNGNQSVGTPGANGSSYTLDQLFATPAVGGGQSVATGDKNLDLMLNNAYGGYKAQTPGWAGTIAQWWNTAKGTYNAAKQSGVIGGLLGGSGNSNLGSLLGGLLTAYTAYRGAQAQEPKDKYTDYSSIQGNHVSLDPSIRNLQNESLGNTGALESGVMGYGTKFRNRSDENAGAYDKLYAELTSNQNPFIQARVDPLKGQIASRRGELQRSQGLRGVSGSSFGNDELTNFDFGANRELGNATATATQEALGARSGTLGNIGAQNTSTLAGNNSITGQLNSLNTNRTGIAGQRSAQELASLGLSDQAAQQLQQAAINKNDIYANILKGYLG